MKVYEIGELKNIECKFARDNSVALETTKSQRYEISKIISSARNAWFEGKFASEDELKAFIKAKMDNLEFKSPKTKNLAITDNTQRLIRFLRSEKRTPATNIPEEILDIYGVPVRVAPTFLYISKDCIEVVKMHNKKRDLRDADVETDRGLYALFCFAKKYVPKGSKMVIRASYYYLRKDNDSYSITRPNFDWDFFDETGKNVVSVEEEFERTLSVEPYGPETLYDVRMEQEFKAFAEGQEKDVCDDKQCEGCIRNQLCNYKASPKALIKEKKQRSLSDLTLSKEQEQAINYSRGVVRINAGAGAGKTLVVALRTVTLMLSGVRPEEIALFTFTNTGALEMRERIEMYNEDFGNGDDISGMFITTFNSFGDTIIADTYPEFGFSDVPSVIDNIQRSVIISNIIKDKDVPGIDYRNYSMDSKFYKGALAVAKKVFDVMKRGNYTENDIDEIHKGLGGVRNSCTRDSVLELAKLYDDYDAYLKAENLIELLDNNQPHESCSEMDGVTDRSGVYKILMDRMFNMN